MGLINSDDDDKHWTLQTNNKTKIYTDAAIFRVSNNFFFAYVARDQNGKLVETRASCKHDHLNQKVLKQRGFVRHLARLKTRV